MLFFTILQSEQLNIVLLTTLPDSSNKLPLLSGSTTKLSTLSDSNNEDDDDDGEGNYVNMQEGMQEVRSWPGEHVI